MYLAVVQQQTLPPPVGQVEDGIGHAAAVDPVGADLNDGRAKLLSVYAASPSGRGTVIGLHEVGTGCPIWSQTWVGLS